MVIIPVLNKGLLKNYAVLLTVHKSLENFNLRAWEERKHNSAKFK